MKPATHKKPRLGPKRTKMALADAEQHLRTAALGHWCDGWVTLWQTIGLPIGLDLLPSGRVRMQWGFADGGQLECEILPEGWYLGIELGAALDGSTIVATPEDADGYAVEAARLAEEASERGFAGPSAVDPGATITDTDAIEAAIAAQPRECY